MGGREKGFLGRLVGGLTADDLAVVENQNSVAYQRDLGQLTRIEEYRRPASGEFAQQLINLLLGSHVDATSGVETEQDTETCGEPSTDYHLLLVPTREASRLATGPRIDRQAIDG